MKTLVSIDSYSLSRRLKSETAQIDYRKLFRLLSFEGNPVINYYTDEREITRTDSKLMGRVISFDRGFGRVISTDGRSFFLHHTKVYHRSKQSLVSGDRFPHPSSEAFSRLMVGKIVSFDPKEADKGLEAINVKIETREKAINQFHCLKNNQLLRDLVRCGYRIVRCSPSKYPKRKSKSIDINICLDALELTEGDSFVLISDDPPLLDLLIRLKAKGVFIKAVFDENTQKLFSGAKLVPFSDFLQET